MKMEMESKPCKTAKSKSYSLIEVENLRNHRSLSLKTQLGQGDVFLSVPRELAEELGYDLQDATRSNAVMVNGVRKRGPMIGPLRVKIGNRYSDLSAIVQGREPMLCGIAPEILHDAGRDDRLSANDAPAATKTAA